jgi:hypothetical protein
MCLTEEQAKEVMKTLAEIPRLREEVEEVKKVVCGNGHEGLVAIVLKHTMMLEFHQKEYSELKAHQDKKEEVGANRNWALWLVVITTVTNLVVNLVKTAP